MCNDEWQTGLWRGGRSEGLSWHFVPYFPIIAPYSYKNSTKKVTHIFSNFYIFRIFNIGPLEFHGFHMKHCKYRLVVLFRLVTLKALPDMCYVTFTKSTKKSAFHRGRAILSTQLKIFSQSSVGQQASTLVPKEEDCLGPCRVSPASRGKGQGKCCRVV